MMAKLRAFAQDVEMPTCAAAPNPAIAVWLQSTRPAGRVAGLAS